MVLVVIRQGCLKEQQNDLVLLSASSVKNNNENVNQIRCEKKKEIKRHPFFFFGTHLAFPLPLSLFFFLDSHK